MIVVYILTFIIGCINGLKDKSALNWFKKSWWNKGDGWRNKWSWINSAEDVRMPLRKSPQYYLGLYNPGFKESFPYSSTALVFLTDGWHLLQFIQFKVMMIGFAILMVEPHPELMEGSISVIIYHTALLTVVFAAGFNIMYDVVLKGDKQK